MNMGLNNIGKNYRLLSVLLAAAVASITMSCSTSIRGEGSSGITSTQASIKKDAVKVVNSPKAEATLVNLQDANPPACEIPITGTYKNENGDIATLKPAEGSLAGYAEVTIYLRSEGSSESLKFIYGTPNGYGVSSTAGDDTRKGSPAGTGKRSIYHSSLGAWDISVFGEGNPIWYSDDRIYVPDSIWFRVLCEIDIEEAKDLSLPTL